MPEPDLTLPPDPVDLEREAQVTGWRTAPRFWAHYGTPLLRRLLGAIREESK